MRDYRVSGIALFVLLVAGVGCKTAPPSSQLTPERTKALGGDGVAPQPVSITATSEGLVTVEIDKTTNQLIFKTADSGEDGGFTVFFPKDMITYPPACKPVSDTQPPKKITVCPNNPQPCDVNPKIINNHNQDGYYEIKGGAECSKEYTPIPYSVVHCPHC